MMAAGVVGNAGGLLGPQPADLAGRKCLVLDLDETLVHSSFKPVRVCSDFRRVACVDLLSCHTQFPFISPFSVSSSVGLVTFFPMHLLCLSLTVSLLPHLPDHAQVPNPDYIVPIEIDGQQHRVYVLKRPHVDKFLAAVGKLYEVVLFTASLSKYADPVTDLLDPDGVCRFRLFREHCVFHRGSYVKDLSRLGRPLDQTIIVDNSPASYIFQPNNAVPCRSWFDDRTDTELLELIPFFENMAQVSDIHQVLR